MHRFVNSRRVAVAAVMAGAAALFTFVPTASAAIVPTVPLATTAGYSVLAATTVTNTNLSVLNGSVGLSPGTAIVGFPPGIINAPAIKDTTATALAAQGDLTIAYNNAAGRPVGTQLANPDLVGVRLAPGVYAAASKAPLGLSGRLVLDGQGNADAVFIFQTDSTLITGSASSVALINGASECNVFWQVGSSATLGSGSSFVGNILALTSITVESNVTVHGRALARNGAVTLDNDTFSPPSCEPSANEAPATTTTIDASAVTTTIDASAATTTIDASAATTTIDASAATTEGTTDATSAPAAPGAGSGSSNSDTSLVSSVTTSPNASFDDTDITLPVTGSTTEGTLPIAAGAVLIGLIALVMSRRRSAA